VRYIRDQKLDRPVIVGHSLGGFLGFWIAATTPDAVGGVIAVDGVPFLPALTNPGATADTSRPVAEQMRTLYASSTPAQLVAPSKMAMARMMRAESDVERTLAWVAASDPATTGRATYELLVTDLRKDVSAITAPVLLVGAEAPASDAAARARLQAAYEAQVAAVPRHTVVMVDRARHFIMFDEPDALWSTMDTFLAGLSAGAK
jgi:pimeloyl-ACP methyl ester carboxylesterase